LALTKYQRGFQARDLIPRLIDRSPENQQHGGMKTTLDLPNDLVREMKLRAVNEGKKLKDVVADLIRRGLRGDDAARAMPPRKGHIDLPLFPTTADAPAGHMTMGEIIAAEQESLFGEDVERLRQSV
jgi:hypothetical protein